MGDLFQSLFGANAAANFFGPSHRPRVNPSQQPPQAVPPASARAISNLNLVKITVDDLQEEGNKECLICLVEQQLGSHAVKLPCGHIYHKPCLVEWLNKHAACPVCRYELETNDPAYELYRKESMKKRKIRLRKSELEKKSVSQLRDICSLLSISTSDCTDKLQIVEKLIASGMIEITDSVPAIEITREELYSKPVKELRHLLLSFDISCTGVIEKAEICEKLIESGRIVLVCSPSPTNSNEKPRKDENGSYSSPTKATLSSQFKPSAKISKQDLMDYSTSQLQDFCRLNGISLNGCLERSDIIQRIEASHITVIDNECPADTKYSDPRSIYASSKADFDFMPQSKSNDAKGIDRDRKPAFVFGNSKAEEEYDDLEPHPISPVRESAAYSLGNQSSEDALLALSIKELKSIDMRGMAGGFKPAEKATPDIQSMVDALKIDVESHLGVSLPVYVAHSFTSQVVAGTNYLVKVNVGEDKFIHVKVHKPLPHTGNAPHIMDVENGKTENCSLLPY